MPKTRPFQVEIEARLTVLAFDEDSASKKAARALAAGHTLAAGRSSDTDVNSTGAVWT